MLTQRRLLSDTLHMFAHPLVDIVVSYIAFLPAELGADVKAEALCRIQLKPSQYSAAECGVACSPISGEIWVTLAESASIFNADCEFVRFAAQGQLKWAAGAAIAGNGEAFIADATGTGYGIVVCRADGSEVRRIDNIRPHHIAIDNKQQLLFVTEYSADCVHMLDRESGRCLLKWGCHGGSIGPVGGPDDVAMEGAYGVAVNPITQQVCVCDRGNCRLKVLSFGVVRS